MSSIEDLMSQIPMDQVAAQLGVDQAQAEQAVREALPALVGGMSANAQDPGGAASLAQALNQHGGDSLLDGGIDLGQVDTDDGAKIVKNVFGDNEEAVVNQLGGVGGLGGGMFTKLLPMLAPLVMAFLAKSFGGGAKASAVPAGDDSAPGSLGPDDVIAAQPSGEAGGGGGLGDLLGGGGGGLSDMLGGLLGGGGLGDLLGGLLGGGRKG